MSERHDIVIDQGSEFTFSIRWQHDDQTPVDLTDASARMQIRESFSSETPELDLDSESKGGISLNVVTGEIDVLATAAQTAAMTAPMLAKYDLEVEWPGGVVRRVVEGNARIKPEVTR